ncbi:RAB6-interacting golgin, partial [Quillaja saponaria]
GNRAAPHHSKAKVAKQKNKEKRKNRKKEKQRKERKDNKERNSRKKKGFSESSEMQTTEQPQQQQQLMVQNSGSMSFSSHLSKEDEEMSKSALSTFRAKEEEIEKKKMEVRDKVQAHLGRVEEETKRLALIREELEALADPMRKEVALVRKRIDSVNKELKPLGHTCQKKEKEYKDALEAFNEKNREKVQLITKLMELVSESEKMRMTKLEELSKHVDSIH